VVGWYNDSNGVVHGFLYNGSIYTKLDPQGSISTKPHTISGNIVGGQYEDSTGNYHGFLYNGSTYTVLDAPGSVYGTVVIGISGNYATGSYLDSEYTGHSFLYSMVTNTFLEFDPPRAELGIGVYASEAFGISNNLVAGNYNTINGQTTTLHGYIATFTSKATVTLGHLSAVYNGSPQAVTATTSPTGLNVSFTYGGSATAPTNAGGYTVVGTVNDSIYQGSATGTLVISQGAAAVTLGGLATTYNGAPQAATATTNPTGLNVTFTYNGNATSPTNAGSYTVVGTVNDANYTGSATGTLVIGKGPATVTLANLSALYNGSPQAATATTSPSGLNVSLTYNGIASPPTAVGSYAVVGTVNDPNYQGSASGTLVITTKLTFSQWEATYSFSGTAIAMSLGDGVSNLLKYVCDIDPSQPMTATERERLPVVVITGTTETLTFHEYSLLTGVNVEVETSPDLQVWTAVSSTQIGTDAATKDPIMQAQVTITPPREFIRLNVIQP